jgi:hypothetical protein
LNFEQNSILIQTSQNRTLRDFGLKKRTVLPQSGMFFSARFSWPFFCSFAASQPSFGTLRSLDLSFVSQ